MSNFLTFEILQISSVFIVNYCLGRLVLDHNVRVNYTRKIFSLSLFFLTMYLINKFPFESTPLTTAINGVLLVLSLFSMSKELRENSQFLNTTFAAINRPEDEPYTLLWLPTELILMSTILFFMQAYLAKYEQSALFPY